MEQRTSNAQFTELADRIIADLREYQNPELVRQVVKFVGIEEAQKIYDQTMKIEASGGMMTRRGDRRRAPGGVFFTIVQSNLPDIEQELLFPSGRSELPESYIIDSLQKLSINQLEIGANQIEQKTNRLSPTENFQRTQLLKIKQLVLKRLEDLRSRETNSSIAEIKEAVNDVQDPQAKAALLERVQELEKLTTERKSIRDSIMDVELERQRAQIQLETEERRTKNRAQYWGQFLARESVATILGDVLLFILTISLLIAMFLGIIETRIIENALLLLLGYFFGQTTSRSSQESTKDKQ